MTRRTPMMNAIPPAIRIAVADVVAGVARATAVMVRAAARRRLRAATATSQRERATTVIGISRAASALVSSSAEPETVHRAIAGSGPADSMDDAGRFRSGTGDHCATRRSSHASSRRARGRRRMLPAAIVVARAVSARRVSNESSAATGPSRLLRNPAGAASSVPPVPATRPAAAGVSRRLRHGSTRGMSRPASGQPRGKADMGRRLAAMGDRVPVRGRIWRWKRRSRRPAASCASCRSAASARSART